MGATKKEYISNVVQKIVELKDTLDDINKGEIIYKSLKQNLGKDFKVNINWKLAAISYFLKKEGMSDMSEMTIYRILKIKELDDELFLKVKNGDIKIKQAYNILFPPKEKEIKTELKKEVERKEIINFDEEPNYELIYSYLQNMREQIDFWKLKTKHDPEMQLLRNIDNELFKFRKTICDVMQIIDSLD